MGGKAASIFERVLGQVNQRKSRRQGPLERADLAAILEKLDVAKPDWYAALARAKKQTPNLYELFYAAFGESPPKRGKAADAAPASEEAAPEAEAEPEAEEEAPADGDISPADVLSTVVAWIEKLPRADRRRVMAAASAFFPADA